MNKKKYEIKHHKDFHKIQLQGLKVKERNIFMTLCYKAMEQEDTLLKFDVDEIAKISGYTQQTGENIYTYLKDTYKSLQNITIEIDKDNGFKSFVLFTMFETFEDKGIVHFDVNKHYRHLLNQVTSPFTIQDMIEYRALDSGYSQLMYSILKEWEGSKFFEISIEDFRQKLGIPETYRMSTINARVLNPIKKELTPYFLNLKIEKIKRGRNIAKIKFTWQVKKKTKQPLQLVNYAEQQQNIDTPIMSEVRTCIEKYPLACAGHIEDETNKRCQQARKYTV